MKKTNLNQADSSAVLEPTIKRSRAAEILDKTPRTLARYETRGILRPIKLNSRSVVYRVTDIQKILNGDFSAAAPSANVLLLPRTKHASAA